VLHNKVGVPKSFSLFGHFSVVFFLSISFLQAETFENFKRSTADAFLAYKDKNDIEFAKYLKQHFRAYIALKPVNIYDGKKPDIIPPSMSKKVKSSGPTISVNIQKQETMQEPLIQKSKDEVKDIIFSFFGSNLKFDIPNGIKNARYYPQNQKGISRFFNIVASSEYESLLHDIDTVCNNLELNDWGVYLLINTISKHALLNSDDAKLLSWFLFNKMGYFVKVGLVSKHIVLMYNSKKIIYSIPSYKFKDKSFYLIENNKSNPTRVYSYEKDYPSSTKAFDLSLKTLPKFINNVKKKTLKFKQYSKNYEIEFSYNKNIIDFMMTYPQADYETFFNAPIQNQTYEDIAKGLKKYIDGKKASTAINFVLNFVQNAFLYQVDNKQFGHEKVMFAQEALYYEKSDCEDRAVLFSYLAKKLFGFSVVGVKYKDHMATALYIPIKGDEVRAKSKRYVIADPSYINASIGQSMPKYKLLKPESFIMIDKN